MSSRAASRISASASSGARRRRVCVWLTATAAIIANATMAVTLHRPLLVAVLLALAIPAVAHAADRIGHYQARFTTPAPGSPSGRLYEVDFVNPADPQGKPPSVQHVHLQLPAGARYDTDAAPQCHASDPELMAQGADACPASSRLGTNDLVFDTGIDAARFLNEDVTFFNEHDQLVILAQDRATGARTVTRGVVGRDTLDIELPMVPGSPPDGAADKSERAVFNAVGGYLTTPPTCPASGEWTEHVTYTFRDGVKQTVSGAMPCRRGQRAR